ncbi:DUF1045 domain-containing protein [Candidatus Woesebacteria bacterium]|nr:DUF1045 domain-containing protein [Candidatus Woesebacteria bacterium]
MINSFQRINIVVKVNQAISSKMIRLSGEVAKGEQEYFILDGVNFVPHITLYATEYPSKNLDKMFEAMNRISKSSSAFTIRSTEVGSHLGYVDIAFECTEELISLHQRIVTQLNPFREGHLRAKYSSPDELKQYSVQEQEYIQEYGYPGVFDSFTPHLTVARFQDEKVAQRIATSLDYPSQDIRVDTLAAYAMGEHGTCNQLLKEWKFE